MQLQLIATSSMKNFTDMDQVDFRTVLLDFDSQLKHPYS